jgi:hypothetical protein
MPLQGPMRIVFDGLGCFLFTRASDLDLARHARFSVSLSSETYRFAGWETSCSTLNLTS